MHEIPIIMNSGDSIDKEYKRLFNLGYELAKELHLKSPMFENQNSGKTPTNSIQAGMFQYINEARLLKIIDIAKSVEKSKAKGKSKNSGRGLTPQ